MNACLIILASITAAALVLTLLAMALGWYLRKRVVPLYPAVQDQSQLRRRI